jgi:hypothetical protein
MQSRMQQDRARTKWIYGPGGIEERYVEIAGILTPAFTMPYKTPSRHLAALNSTNYALAAASPTETGSLIIFSLRLLLAKSHATAALAPSASSKALAFFIMNDGQSLSARSVPHNLSVVQSLRSGYLSLDVLGK